MCHHPWASVAFIKQIERETQGLKGITDQRRDKPPSHGKELFFAIKEEKHGSEVGRQSWSSYCEEIALLS